MCGIAGYFNSPHLKTDDLKKMAHSIRHRGPDGEGYYQNPKHFVGLAHQRLSILDLTNNGAQPLTYQDSGLWITYNGEIYNYLELRQELESIGYSFRSNTDTEVLLAAYIAWGVASFQKLNGMFAFCIYNERTNALLLCRDYYGIKPLYFWKKNNALVFGSEIKVFASIKENLNLQWDETGIRSTLHRNYGFEATEHTLFADVKRLLPGHYLHIEQDKFTIKSWWNFSDSTPCPDKKISDQITHFKSLFFDACNIRMRSDVAVGASLSGGLDSGSILSVLSQMQYPVQSFIHSFQESFFDETEDASLVAKHYNLDPIFLGLDYSEMLNHIDKHIYFSDGLIASFFPSSPYRLYNTQRTRNIKVSIDGHGSDEMLGGYYWFLPYARQSHSRFSFRYHQMVRQQRNMGGPPHKRKKKSDTLTPDYSLQSLLQGEIYPERTIALPTEWSPLKKHLHYAFYSFTLPSTLDQVDLMSMAHGIEVRLPFLDPRLVNYVFSLPDSSKITKGYSKYILRESMRNILPEKIRIKKYKTPFSSPPLPRQFLHQELRPWIDEVLSRKNALSDFFPIKELKKFYYIRLQHKSCNNADIQLFYKILSCMRLSTLIYDT